ncbi:MAG: hypothetical protein JSV91_06155 [Phycisphaerales bacterium]|nr:MAG: hypothetical protein JSV91_06155 [Phycisphaerales bacterium]
MRAIESLAPAVSRLESRDEAYRIAREAARRGVFTPRDDEQLRLWYARYLTARTGLLEVINDLRPFALEGRPQISPADQLQFFVIAYTAACLLVRAARFLVFDFATDKIVQRKLNEPDERLRIPRKQYTAVYRSLTSPVNAYHLSDAVRFADDHRAEINALNENPQMRTVLEYLKEAEPSLQVDMGEYVKARLRYRWHSWRWRRASACQQMLFGILEACGCVIADVANPFHTDRMTGPVRRQLRKLLLPGDVIIARHDQVLSNLFLPGYWPHAALHIGPPSTRSQLPLRISPEHAARWVKPKRVLEAKKDGVLFRRLQETITVDALAVIRPRLTTRQIAEAISQAVSHEGKLYNFDFDFFTADRLVCTEVIYRAYDGIGGIRFELSRRGGMPTLSADDILTLAVEGGGFEPVALFGTPSVGKRLLTGPEAAAAMAESLRQT